MIYAMPNEDWREGLAPGATKRPPYPVPADGGSELVAGFQPAPMFAQCGMNLMTLLTQRTRLWVARPYTNPTADDLTLF